MEEDADELLLPPAAFELRQQRLVPSLITTDDVTEAIGLNAEIAARLRPPTADLSLYQQIVSDQAAEAARLRRQLELANSRLASHRSQAEAKLRREVGQVKEDLANQRAESQAALANREAEIARLRQQHSNSAKVTTELQQRLHATESSLQAANDRLQQLQPLAAWDEQREATLSRLAELEAMNEQLSADNHLLTQRLRIHMQLQEAEVNDGEQQLQQQKQQQQMSKWRQQVYQLMLQREAVADTHARELNELQQQVQRSAEQQQQLRLQLSDSKAEIESVQRKLAASERHSAQLQQNLQRLTQQRSVELSAIASSVQSVADNSKQFMLSTDDRIKQQQDRLAALSERVTSLSSHLSCTVAQAGQLADTQAQLEAERAAHRTDSAKLTDVIDSLRKELEKSQIARSQAERRLQREQEAGETQAQQLTQDFEQALERLRERLRIVEGERNLLQASARQQGLLAGRGLGATTDSKLSCAVQDIRQLMADTAALS